MQDCIIDSYKCRVHKKDFTRACLDHKILLCELCVQNHFDHNICEQSELSEIIKSKKQNFFHRENIEKISDNLYELENHQKGIENNFFNIFKQCENYLREQERIKNIIKFEKLKNTLLDSDVSVISHLKAYEKVSLINYLKNPGDVQQNFNDSTAIFRSNVEELEKNIKTIKEMMGIS